MQREELDSGTDADRRAAGADAQGKQEIACRRRYSAVTSKIYFIILILISESISYSFRVMSTWSSQET